MNQCKIVAELSTVHLGQMERAKHLIKRVALAGAHYAKFQKRNPIESVPADLQNKPHPNPIFAYGKTYLEHRINLEFSLDQHRELKEWCEYCDIKYASSVWDLTSVNDIIALNPDFIKIPSACNHNHQMINVLINNYEGDIHISTGMMSLDERAQLFDFILSNNPERFVVYHCTSEYPCPFEHLFIADIEQMSKQFSKHNIRFGFSNHGYGIAADIAAFMLGAEWIERHVVDDRTLKHSDAAASLEFGGLEKLCRDLKNTHKAVQYKGDITDQEKVQRYKLRVS